MAGGGYDFASWLTLPVLQCPGGLAQVDEDYALALEASIEADRQLREMQDWEYEQSLLADAARQDEGEDAGAGGGREGDWLCQNCRRTNLAPARNCTVCLVARPEGGRRHAEPATAPAVATATSCGEVAAAAARVQIVSLPDEPEGSENSADIIVHLPSVAHNAGRVRRRFANSAPLHWVFMLLQNEGVDLASVRLATRFPRRLFDFATHAELTVAEAGLCPSAMLFSELA